MEVDELREFAERAVSVRLNDGSEHVGVLRTELLTERSISVFIARPGGGATLYIDQITDVSPQA